MATVAPDRQTIDRRKGSYYAQAKTREAGEIEHLVGQCQDVALRDRLRVDLQSFLTHCFPEAFPLPFSPDHLTVIQTLQKVILEGGQFAVAMPRGFGKTTIAIRGAIWGILYGHRRSAVIVACSDPQSLKLLRDIKTELRFNDRLAELFPDVCASIRHIEGRAIRANSQTYQGVPTGVVWKSDELLLPQMSGSLSSGARFGVAGILGGRIRGQNHTTNSGEVLRPDIVIVDDPQDRESAKSPTQTADRLAVINGDVMGMAGPTRKIACIVPCTVIQQDDAADQILDRRRNPHWNGWRSKALDAWPEDMAFWEEYRAVRARSMQDGRGCETWNQFLKDNWDRAHKGAKASWPERYKREDELSAVQSCLNWHFDNPSAFAAEGQNEPLKESCDEIEQLTVNDIGDKANELQRRTVPLAASRITSFVDVQGKMLYWLNVAWSDDFTGHVIDYGTFPDQRRAVFTLADSKRSLAHLFPGVSEESRIYEGLTSLANEILGTTYVRADGLGMRIERMLVDSGAWTDTIYKWCRETNWRDRVTPSKGRSVGAAKVPMSEYKPREGERVGHNWVMTTIGRGSIAARLIQPDTYYWKTQLYRKIKAGRADKGTLTLFGKSHEHPTLAAHCTAEIAKQTFGNGRSLWEWIAKPNKDNHWWDCLVGNLVAASLQGVVLEAAQAKPVVKKRKTLAEMAAQQRRR